MEASGRSYPLFTQGHAVTTKIFSPYFNTRYDRLTDISDKSQP